MEQSPSSHLPRSDSPLTPTSETQLAPGEMIGGRFSVEAFIRRDFIGDVYQTRDSQSQRLVECLMMNLPQTQSKHLLTLRGHIHEVKRLSLKSFATIYGIGKLGEHGYVVRQVLEGRPLTEHLNHRAQHNKPFKQRGLCSLLVEVLQALEAMRSQEIGTEEHGFIRPNVIMIQNHQKPRVRLTDVGLSVIRSELVKHSETDPWSLGCIPELQGLPDPGDRDLYSLGALLYQMTQLKPFMGDWQRDLMIPKTFPKLPDLIEACVANPPLITANDLKAELKSSARAQVESGGLTQDLSQLQERLHQIIHTDASVSEDDVEGQGEEVEQEMNGEVGAEMSESTLQESEMPIEHHPSAPQHQLPAQSKPVHLPAEESFGGIFTQLPEEHEGQELSEELGISLTPSPLGQRVSETPPPAQVEAKPSGPVSPYPNPIAAETVGAQEREPADIEPDSAEQEVVEQKRGDDVNVDMSQFNEIFDDSTESASTESASIKSASTESASTESASTESASTESIYDESGTPKVERDQIIAQPSTEALPQIKDEYQEQIQSEPRENEVLASFAPVDDLLSQIETFHGAELILEDSNDEDLNSSAELHANSSTHPLPPALPIPPPPPPPSVQDDPTKPRWIVVKEGIDYGPFTRDELVKQLFAEEIKLETEICDLEIDHRASLGEFDSLSDVISAWAHERIERERRKAILIAKRKARRRLMIAVGGLLSILLIVGGITYGPILYESMLPPPTQMKFSEWVSKAPQMTSLKHLEESPEAKASRKKSIRSDRLRREALKDARDMAKEAKEASESQIDLNGRRKVGRRFSRKDFDKALSKRMSRLMKCLERERKRSPELKVLTIALTVQGNGRFLNGRFVKGSNPGQRCVFKAIRGLKIKSFDGTDVTIKLPFKLE